MDKAKFYNSFCPTVGMELSRIIGCDDMSLEFEEGLMVSVGTPARLM